MASQTGMEAVPHPTMPKRTGFVSGMIVYILGELLAVQPSDEIGIGVTELCPRGERRHKSMLHKQIGRIFGQTTIRISECPRSLLKLLEPSGRGFDLGCPLFRVDPIEPGMTAAVSAKVHAASSHFVN